MSVEDHYRELDNAAKLQEQQAIFTKNKVLLDRVLAVLMPYVVGLVANPPASMVWIDDKVSWPVTDIALGSPLGDGDTRTARGVCVTASGSLYQVEMTEAQFNTQPPRKTAEYANLICVETSFPHEHATSHMPCATSDYMQTTLEEILAFITATTPDGQLRS